MWLVEWLISLYDRVYNIFETWWNKIRGTFDTYYQRLYRWLHYYYFQAHVFLDLHVDRLTRLFIDWWEHVFLLVFAFWGYVYTVATEPWLFVWNTSWEGFKDIIKFIHDVKEKIQDFFVNLYASVVDLLTNTWDWIWGNLRGWVQDALALVRGWYTEIVDFFVNLYHQVADFLSRAWGWIWEHLPEPIREILTFLEETWEKVKDFFVNLYARISDFLGRVWEWIWERVPQLLRNAWSLITDYFDSLVFLLVDGFLELMKFLVDPFGYITALLEAWITGWRDYIFGVVGDLLDQLIREVILHLMDWMGFVAPPIEVLDEEVDYFSPLTDFLEEGATAWRELKEGWVLSAMEMMEDLAAELRGEEEMVPKRPSQIFWENWWLLPDDIRDLISQPPIKG